VQILICIQTTAIISGERWRCQ